MHYLSWSKYANLKNQKILIISETLIHHINLVVLVYLKNHINLINLSNLKTFFLEFQIKLINHKS